MSMAYQRVSLLAMMWRYATPPTPSEVVALLEAAMRGEKTKPLRPLPRCAKKDLAKAQREVMERVFFVRASIEDWWGRRHKKGADPARLVAMLRDLDSAYTVALFLRAHGLHDAVAACRETPSWWNSWQARRQAHCPHCPQMAGVFSQDPLLWWGQLSLTAQEYRALHR